MLMRPSQYNYIKRAFTRTMFRHSQQKKRLKAKKKELRKQNRLIRKHDKKEQHIVKSARKQERNRNPSFRLMKSIIFGILTILSGCSWLTNAPNIISAEGILSGLFVLLILLSLFGIPTYMNYQAYLKLMKRDIKNSDSHSDDNLKQIHQYQSSIASEDIRKTVKDNIMEEPQKGNVVTDKILSETAKDIPDKDKVTICNPDIYLKESTLLATERDKFSVGMLQRKFNIGFNRANHIMNQLHEAGVVGPEDGAKPRKVLLTGQSIESTLNNIKFVEKAQSDVKDYVLYFKNGHLFDIMPPGSIYDYNARYINSDGVLYDLNNLNDIDQLPVPNFEPCDIFNGYGVTGSLDYFLKMKAANLRNDDLIEQSDFLYRRLYLFMSASGNWTREKDYLDYSKILLRELRFEESECEERKIRTHLEKQPIIQSDANEKLKDRDRNEYYHIVYTLPYDAPKSFSAYRRMKNAKTENFLELAKKAEQRGIHIEYGS